MVVVSFKVENYPGLVVVLPVQCGQEVWQAVSLVPADQSQSEGSVYCVLLLA